MRIRSACPSCTHSSTFLAHGIIAPWLVDLCQIQENLTSLHQCKECGLVFFSYRYSEQELTDLYSDYRSEYFYRLRHSWEPWYDTSVNEAFSAQRTNDNQIDDRRNYTRQVLENAGIVIENLTGCIDFGGDLGQFIPRGIGGDAFVVEKGSGRKKSDNGVMFVETIDLIQEEVDLVLNCYVLEHLPTIDDVLSNMREKLREGGLILFEVPLDKFSVTRIHRSNTYRQYLQFLARHKRLFSAVDFLTGVYRHFFRRIIWFGIVKQSEHINYFDVHSLRRYLESHGSEIIYTSQPDHKYKVGSVRQGRLACIVR